MVAFLISKTIQLGFMVQLRLIDLCFIEQPPKLS